MNDHTPEEREDGKRISQLERENAKLRDGLALIANGGESAVSIAKVTLREASQEINGTIL